MTDENYKIRTGSRVSFLDREGRDLEGRVVSTGKRLSETGLHFAVVYVSPDVPALRVPFLDIYEVRSPR